MKCAICQKDYDKEKLKSVPDMMTGKVPKNGKKYCPSCYNEEIYRRKFIDYCYYLYNKKIAYKLIISQTVKIHRVTGMKYFDMYYTLKYMIEILHINFNEETIEKLDFYHWKAMKHYHKVYELKNKKTFGDIKPIIINNNKINKPNKSKLEPIDMSLI